VSGHGRKLRDGWTSWGRDMPLGFSFKAKGATAEMSPALRGDPALVSWRAVVKVTGLEPATVWADDHWRCSDEVTACVASLQKNPL